MNKIPNQFAGIAISGIILFLFLWVARPDGFNDSVNEVEVIAPSTCESDSLGIILTIDSSWDCRKDFESSLGENWIYLQDDFFSITFSDSNREGYCDTQLPECTIKLLVLYILLKCQLTLIS